MPVNFVRREVEDIIIVDISGRITLGEGSGALRNTIRGLVADGKKKVALNLANTTYIDSVGLGELVSGFTAMANKGGKLKLFSPTTRVKSFFRITKMYSVFEVFDTEAEVVNSEWA